MSLRDGPLGDIKVPLTWAAAVAVVAALIAAIMLLISDRRETLEEQAYGKVRATADAIQAPVSSVVSAPVGWGRSAVNGVRSFFGAIAENPKLRKENKKIPQLEAEVAHQKDVNERLVAILGLKTDPPMPMVTGRAITDARGPFANSRLLNVGREEGIKVGNPVMSENGLVGRIAGVSDKVSRALLLTDPASRTPVMIDRNNARAILTGDGGSHPKLANMRSRDGPKVGDRLVTSGDGGVFPRGLPVGIAVKGVDGAWRAQLWSDRAPIDYVRILKFENFAQLANEQQLTEMVTPEQMGGALPVPVITAPPPPLVLLPTTPGAPAPVPAAKSPAVQPAAPKTAAPVAAAPRLAPPPAAKVIAPPAPVARTTLPPTALPKAAPPPVLKATVAPAGVAPQSPAPQSPVPKPPAAKARPRVATTTSARGNTFRKVETSNAPPRTP